MAKPKKNGTYLNVCIMSDLYTRLNTFCEEIGQTKTTAVERALIQYIDNYEKKQKILRDLESID